MNFDIYIECPICLEYLFDNEYNENQTNRTKRIKLKSCGHIFHHYCIEEYISRCNANEYMKTENNDKYFTCPYCNTKNETNLSIHEKNTMTNMNDRGNGNQLLLQYQKKKYCSNMCCCTIS